MGKAAAAAPLPLVQEHAGVYAVCDEGRRFLEGLAPELPLAVVVVAGRYRTGKSFLLNRGVLEAAAKRGFPTGDSQRACTRGVWIYPAVLAAQDGSCFVALDTEGTASLEAKADQDARLIGIALSLASVFVFNSTGSLDETSLSDLATLTSVAQHITEAQWQAPELLWVLRDFALKLQDEQGQELAPQAYLERALSEELFGKGGVRATLKHFFRQRALLPMVRPCLDETKLQALNDLGNSALRPEFQRQLEQFRQLVRAAAARPKELGGLALNGPALARLAQAAVASVNEGKAPSIQTTFDFLQERRARDFEEEAAAELERRCGELQAQLPLRRLPRLAPPEPPAFLGPLRELWAGCEARLQERCARLQQRLEAANDAACEALAQAALAAPDASGFEEELRRLEGRLGSGRTLQLAPRLHAAHAAAMRAALEEEATRARQEAAALREELAAAALAQAALPPPLPQASPEEVERRAAALRQEAQQELGALSAARDELARELRAAERRLEGAEAGGAAAAARHSEELAVLQRRLDAARQEGHEAAAAQADGAEAAARAAEAGLAELRAEFQAIVRGCEGRARQAQEQAQAAEQRGRASEEQLAQGRERVAAELAALREQQAAARREHEEQRRRQTQELLEKRQQLTEAYGGVVQEAQRSHEAALAADRRLMVAEVERESLKRRVDALEADALELAKARRLCDDLRCRHASAEAAAEASARLQELQASQLLRLEAELRELRAAWQLRDRELTHRAAVLELQLQARGLGGDAL